MNEHFITDTARAFNAQIPSQYQTNNGWEVIFSVENRSDLVELRVAGSHQVVRLRKWMVERDPNTGEKYVLGQNIDGEYQHRFNLEWPWLAETRREGQYIGGQHDR